MSVTAEQVRDLRHRTGLGLFEAKRQLEREDRELRLQHLSNMLSMFDVQPSHLIELIDIIREMNR